jgi:hypothetical protein
MAAPSQTAPERTRPKGPLLLLFPWGVVAALAFGMEIGFSDWILKFFHPSWINWQRTGIGLTVLFAACYASWGFFWNRDQGYKGITLLILTALTTFVFFILSAGLLILLAIVVWPGHW